MTEIFYVEDDSNISQMVKDYLEQRDYRVYLYENGNVGKRGAEASCAAACSFRLEHAGWKRGCPLQMDTR